MLYNTLFFRKYIQNENQSYESGVYRFTIALTFFIIVVELNLKKQEDGV